MIKSIKLRDFVNSSEYSNIEVRILEVNTDKGNFVTPEAAITSTYLNAKADIPSRIYIPDVFRVLNSPLLDLIRIHDILRKGAPASGLQRISQEFLDSQTENTKVNAAYLYVPKKDVDNLSEVNKKDLLLEGVNVLKDCGFSDIFVPYLRLNPDDYLKIYKEISAIDERLNAIPVLDLDDNRFSEFVTRLLDEGVYNLAFKFHKFDSKNKIIRKNYTFMLNNLSNKDVLIISLDTDRTLKFNYTYKQMIEIPTVFIAPFFNIDISIPKSTFRMKPVPNEIDPTLIKVLDIYSLKEISLAEALRKPDYLKKLLKETGVNDPLIEKTVLPVLQKIMVRPKKEPSESEEQFKKKLDIYNKAVNAVYKLFKVVEVVYAEKKYTEIKRTKDIKSILGYQAVKDIIVKLARKDKAIL
ncbi:hypothetical protein HS7_19070 [Sulfolobales archaeon HS-7]|nr:hypothetical protein HS7_19070 [Sulfolobales archaeon HS-7]